MGSITQVHSGVLVSRGGGGGDRVGFSLEENEGQRRRERERETERGSETGSQPSAESDVGLDLMTLGS